MKQFHIFNFPQGCELADKAERLVNTTDSDRQRLLSLREMASDTEIRSFFIACLCYWAEAEHFDERNRAAILFSRKVVEHFPELKVQAEAFNEDILRNAFAFTSNAHRYLQQNLFRCVMLYFKQDPDLSRISLWLDSNHFVLNYDQSDLIPFRDWDKGV